MAARAASYGWVLVADADAGARAFMRLALEQAGYVVREVPSGAEALAAIRTEQPSLAILEVCLPDVSGYEVCRCVRDEFGDVVAVLFVSAERTEWFDRVAGLLIGADDYLVKPFASDELLARVRALLRRARQTTDHLGLTGRELHVLRLLAEGLDLDEIARALVISRTTVRKHIEHILGKLGVHTRAQAVALAYRERLIATEPYSRPMR